MSLKAFHIAFISVSTVLSAVFALWCLREFTKTERIAAAGGATLGTLAVIALVAYGVHFLRRARSVEYL